MFSIIFYNSDKKPTIIIDEKIINKKSFYTLVMIKENKDNEFVNWISMNIQGSFLISGVDFGLYSTEYIKYQIPIEKESYNFLIYEQKEREKPIIYVNPERRNFEYKNFVKNMKYIISKNIEIK